MKKLALILSLSLFAFGTSTVYAQTKGKEKSAVSADAPKITFTKQEHVFGDINEGPIAEYTFEFKNTGKAPLIIQNAQASCGCTTPEWTKEPVLPNKKGKITVRYNTQGRVGPFDKDIWITSNAGNSEDGKTQLKIKGNVIAESKSTEGTPKS